MLQWKQFWGVKDTIKECYHPIIADELILDWETWSASCQDGRFWTTSSWIVFTKGPDALTQAVLIHFAQDIIRRHWTLQDLQWEYRTQLDLHSIGAVFSVSVYCHGISFVNDAHILFCECPRLGPGNGQSMLSGLSALQALVILAFCEELCLWWFSDEDCTSQW